MEAQAKAYLKKYKKDLLPSALLLAGIILLLRIVFPYINDIGALKTSISSQGEMNQNLQSSLNILNSINEGELERDFRLVLRALPENKSIGSIFEALTIASSRSNVSIGSLNVQVGSVYNQEDPMAIAGRNVSGVPFLNLLVRVNGNSTSDIRRFSESLYEIMPVVEVNSVSITDTGGRFDVNFYFKPLNRSGFEAQTIISPLTPAQQELLTTIQSWN